jgi:hypothetical protein
MSTHDEVRIEIERLAEQNGSTPDEPEQLSLVDVPREWENEWTDMPEFVQEDRTEYDKLTVYFATAEDKAAFLQLVGVPEADRTRGIWFPFRRYHRYDGEYRPDLVGPNRYPIYIISKGRADTRRTSIALERLGIPYSIVIEPQEFDQYAAVIDEAKIIVLPFSNLGQGSIPARNFVWDHARASGAKRHWILDDNISEFARLNRNENRIVRDENPFSACEDFVDRYTNVAMAGLQYRFFASYKREAPPYLLNTRVYSCILLDNEARDKDGELYRWRGRYNEDTDLSLRILKDGWCTVLFNAYLCQKAATMTMAGGNTDELYQGDGRLEMARSLQRQHPDVVSIVEKWGRFQHNVNYSPFRFNKLIPRQTNSAKES